MKHGGQFRYLDAETRYHELTDEQLLILGEFALEVAQKFDLLVMANENMNDVGVHKQGVMLYTFGPKDIPQLPPNPKRRWQTRSSVA